MGAPPGTCPISVADRELRSDLLAAAGSLEIAVHGWDVAQACGVDRPLPPALALELLEVVPLFVHDADRPHRFADPVDVPLHARPGARLLAALGRRADSRQPIRRSPRADTDIAAPATTHAVVTDVSPASRPKPAIATGIRPSSTSESPTPSGPGTSRRR